MDTPNERAAAIALADSLHRIRKLARNGTWNLSLYEEQRLDEEIADFREALRGLMRSDGQGA